MKAAAEALMLAASFAGLVAWWLATREPLPDCCKGHGRCEAPQGWPCRSGRG